MDDTISVCERFCSALECVVDNRLGGDRTDAMRVAERRGGEEEKKNEAKKR